ncbi:MAG: anaerobic sulfite reductase subunit AsrB [Armatimonadetes bacterium]|nr:anaerobic sulfite reductase subunit AsrB [Armatimonadota bacterium]
MNANPYLPVRAKILEVVRQTEQIATFQIESPGLNPVPGQFLEVSIPKVGECPLSISDFDSDYIELTVRKVGKVTGALNALRKGDHLFIRGPYGNGFPLEKLAGRHVVMVLGGIGLVPVKSIVNRYYQNGGVKRLDLLVGFRTPREVIFQEELARWQEKFNVVITVDQGEPDWPGRVGLVSELVKEVAGQERAVAIVVGPPAMIRAAAEELLKSRVAKEDIWVSLERRMSCGIGKCGHCKISDQYVCLDGPVFNYRQVEKLVD